MFVLLCIAAPLSGIISIGNLVTGQFSASIFFYTALTIFFVIIADRIIKKQDTNISLIIFAAVFSIIIILTVLFVITGILR